MHRTIAATLALVCAAGAAGYSFPAQDPTPAPAQVAADVVFVGAGDIANCELMGGSRATAALLDNIEGTIFTLGDHAYPSGSAKELRECYEPTWGRFKDRTYPVPGNHDLLTDRGKPFFDYWGERAGPEKRGYYSYELGAWHIIALNSTISATDKSPQMKWLKEDVAAHTTECTLAYWHTPLFSSGPHGGTPEMRDVWKFLGETGADIVLSSHDHIYERFAPQDYKGKLDPDRGIRQFLVGTGGAGVYNFKRVAPNSEVHDNSAYGVLKFTLSPGKYAWEFIPMAGKTFHDSGTGTCH